MERVQCGSPFNLPHKLEADAKSDEDKEKSFFYDKKEKSLFLRQKRKEKSLFYDEKQRKKSRFFTTKSDEEKEKFYSGTFDNS